MVPHTNVKLPWHSFDDKDYEFVSIYRRRFKLPPEARGRHVFVDFEGVMTASTVWINGVKLGEYKGGYTPFSFDLTPHINFEGENVLAVDVDSSERPDIPPFGYQIDYLTFGGIYREVALRVVPGTFIENIFAKPKDVLSGSPRVEVDCFVQHLEELKEPLTLEVELRDGKQVLAKATGQIAASAATTESVAHSVVLENLGTVKLWDLANPNLYSVHVRLLRGSRVVDQDSRRIGFRASRVYRPWLRAEWQGHQAAGSGPSSDLPVCGASHAGQAAAARRGNSSQEAEVQHRAHFALPAIQAFSGCLR